MRYSVGQSDLSTAISVVYLCAFVQSHSCYLYCMYAHVQCLSPGILWKFRILFSFIFCVVFWSECHYQSNQCRTIIRTYWQPNLEHSKHSIKMRATEVWAQDPYRRVGCAILRCFFGCLAARTVSLRVLQTQVARTDDRLQCANTAAIMNDGPNSGSNGSNGNNGTFYYTTSSIGLVWRAVGMRVCVHLSQ